MNAIQAFVYENQPLRAFMRGGDAWFVAADVCRCLALKANKGSYSHHIETLDDDEKILGDRATVFSNTAPNDLGVTPRSNLGVVAEGLSRMGGRVVPASDPLFHDAKNGVWLISEPGVYRLVFRSRKPEAERFKRWLAHEVIPAIRKTGQYGEPRQPMRADIPDVDPDASLSARVGAVSVATRLYGKQAGRALWEELGLPRLVSETLEPAGDDDRAALERILEHRPNDSRSLREWLADALAGDIDAAEALLHHGVKAAPETGGFYIGQSHPSIVGIFKGTAWADGSFKASLKRLGAHTAGRVSFTGHRRFERYQSRVIWLPAALIE